MPSSHFIQNDRCPWAVIACVRGEWRFEDFARVRCVARVKAFWLGHTRRVETRVVRAWIPTR